MIKKIAIFLYFIISLIICGLLLFANNVNYYCRRGFVSWNPLFCIAGLLFLSLLSLFCINKRQSLERFLSAHLKYVAAFILILLLAGQIFFTYSAFFFSDWDPAGVLSPAFHVANGHPENVSQDYFSSFPNNILLFWIYSGILKFMSIFGPIGEYGGAGVMPIVYIQCLLNTVTGYLVFRILRDIFRKSGYSSLISVASLILYSIFIGLSPWLIITYSDAAGLIFPVLELRLYQVYRQRRGGKRPYLFWLLLGLITRFGYNIKPQAVIMVIAIVIIEAFEANSKPTALIHGHHGSQNNKADSEAQEEDSTLQGASSADSNLQNAVADSTLQGASEDSILQTVLADDGPQKAETKSGFEGGRSNSVFYKIRNFLALGLGILVMSLVIKGIIIPSLGLSLNPAKTFGAAHYFMMGLNDESDGVYNAGDGDYTNSFDDPSERTAADLSLAFDRIRSYGPAGLLRHGMRKTLVNFNDGTFAWGLNGNFFASTIEGQTTFLTDFLRKLIYTDGSLFPLYASYQQTLWLLILFASLGMGLLLRKSRFCHLTEGPDMRHYPAPAPDTDTHAQETGSQGPHCSSAPTTASGTPAQKSDGLNTAPSTAPDTTGTAASNSSVSSRTDTGTAALTPAASSSPGLDREGGILSAVIALSLIGITIFELLFEAMARYLFIYSPVWLLAAVIGWTGICFTLLQRKGRKHQ
ncbi:MAG: hypothetical protein K5989_07220 [Lachnospiraceae bacterium]|nr:hypothetical protein [Lachnospiraceae bacterium]